MSCVGPFVNVQKVLILGVTASGKGRLGFDLARRLDGEILSIDSMKVYRRMDIGTAKPSAERRREVAYHLIDVVEPSESFSVAAFLERANRAVADILARGRPVIGVGGTALYIKALLYGLFDGPGSDETIRNELRQRAQAEGPARLHAELAAVDPAAADRINPNDIRRTIRAIEVYRLTGRPISSFQTQFDAGLAHRGDSSTENTSAFSVAKPTTDGWTLIGLRRDKAEESHRINARTRKMVESGLVDEVRALLAEDRPLSQQARAAIGYAEVIEHLAGRLTLDEALEQIKINTRRLAKGQRTWFKTFGNVHWLDVAGDESPEHVLSRAESLLFQTK